MKSVPVFVVRVSVHVDATSPVVTYSLLALQKKVKPIGKAVRAFRHTSPFPPELSDCSSGALATGQNTTEWSG
jgi:hypothetical protein